MSLRACIAVAVVSSLAAGVLWALAYHAAVWGQETTW